MINVFLLFIDYIMSLKNALFFRLLVRNLFIFQSFVTCSLNCFLHGEYSTMCKENTVCD